MGADSHIAVSRYSDLHRFKGKDLRMKEAIRAQVERNPEAFLSLRNRNPPPVRSRFINNKNK